MRERLKKDAKERSKAARGVDRTALAVACYDEGRRLRDKPLTFSLYEFTLRKTRTRFLFFLDSLDLNALAVLIEKICPLFLAYPPHKNSHRDISSNSTTFLASISKYMDASRSYKIKSFVWRSKDKEGKKREVFRFLDNRP